MASAFKPLRRTDVLVEIVAGEQAIHDERMNRFHALNPAMTRIWELCDGLNTVEQIAAAVGLPAGLTDVALAELAERGLLVNGHEANAKSRREVLRTLAAAGAIGVFALPIISSMTNAVAAAPGTCIGENDGPCATNDDCCAGLVCVPGLNNFFFCSGTE